MAKEVINNSNYTEDNIKTLEWNEHIRRRAGMYVGRLGNGEDQGDGIYVLLKEVVDNSIDEFAMGFGKNIQITIEGKEVTVRDYGRGIPLGKVAEVVSNLNTGGKFDDEAFQKSIGLNGVGTKAVNALSSYFYVESYRDGESAYACFCRGEKTDEGRRETKEKNGTFVKFIPDYDMFGDFAYNMEYVEAMVKNFSYLKRGLTVTLNGVPYKSENGLLDLVNDSMTETPLYPPIHLIGDDIEVVLTHGNSYGENIASFVNGQNTREGGTHLAALREAVVKTLKEFYKKDYAPEDIRQGIIGAISIQIQEPNFEGQTKTKLGSTYMWETDVQNEDGTHTYEQGPTIRSAVNEFLKTNLEIYFIENPLQAEIFANQVLVNKRSRENAEATRLNIKKKLTGSLDIANRVEKFVNCRSKDPAVRELYIVEGDSALTSCKLGRNAEFQAIIPVRGKTLNCMKSTYDKIFKSEIITDLLRVIGCGVEIDGKVKGDFPRFDINSLRWSKIIICTDADEDGFQIRTLLLTLFYRLLPTLLQEGRVFIAESPLFEITAKDKIYFAYNEFEKADILKKLAGQKYTLQRSKGLGENEPEMMWQTTMNPASRRLIAVTPTDAAATEEIFDTLLGDNLPARKKFIAEHGTEYIKDADV